MDAVSTFFAIPESAAATDPEISKCILDLQEGFTKFILLVCKLLLAGSIEKYILSQAAITKKITQN